MRNNMEKESFFSTYWLYLVSFRRCSGDGWARLHVLPGPERWHLPLEGGERLHYWSGGNAEWPLGPDRCGCVWCCSARWVKSYRKLSRLPYDGPLTVYCGMFFHFFCLFGMGELQVWREKLEWQPLPTHQEALTVNRFWGKSRRPCLLMPGQSFSESLLM